MRSIRLRRMWVPLGCFLVALHALSTSARGWWPFAHCYLSDLDPNDFIPDPLGVVPYVNLPDLWKSWERPGSLTVEVSPYFCWSHACQRAGTIGIAPAIPRIPTAYRNPPGVHNPCQAMRTLYEKMRPDHRDPQMEKTWDGFARHNAQDGIVHFTYFPGGTATLWLEHRDKEEWADYVCYAKRNGYSETNWLSDQDHDMSAAGHAGLICLTQKVFRKNRQKVDRDGFLPHSEQYESIAVEDRATLEGKIDEMDQSLRNARYDFGRYQTLMQMAAVEDPPGTPAWTEGELNQMISDAHWEALDGCPNE